MIDEWVQDIKTGEAWRLDSDRSRPVYRTEAGGIEFRDGLGSMSNYKFFPCCPKEAPTNRNIQETGEQLTIFDFLQIEDNGEQKTDPETLGELREKYLARGYRPRIAEALARRDLGRDNPDAFLLKKFNITGEDKNK